MIDIVDELDLELFVALLHELRRSFEAKGRLLEEQHRWSLLSVRLFDFAFDRRELQFVIVVQDPQQLHLGIPPEHDDLKRTSKENVLPPLTADVSE